MGQMDGCKMNHCAERFEINGFKHCIENVNYCEKIFLLNQQGKAESKAGPTIWNPTPL